jgi:hypothetical protein
MARELGLPTRVVVGFVPGEKQDDGSWSVSWHDAHAWPEVYFQGVGWTRFEPTPRTDNAGIDVPAYTVAALNPGGNGPKSSRPDDNRPQPNGNKGQILPPKTDPLTADAAGAGTATTPFPWKWVAVAVLVVVVVLLPWAIRVSQHRRRLRQARSAEPRTAAAAAWSELAATCTDLDRSWPTSRTPRQVAAGLIADANLSGTSEGEALARTARAVEYARYARTPAPTDGLADDLLLGLRGLRAAASRPMRLRASFLPRSLLSRAGSRTADVLDWVDTAPRRMGTALRPRSRNPSSPSASNPRTAGRR